MKLTIKIALVISLFCATAFAEGDMTSGGFACGEQTNGGVCLTNNPTDTKTFDAKVQKDTQDDILVFVRNFLAEIFG